MKNISKNIVFVVTSVILISIVFGAGFYTGTTASNNKNALADTESPADLSSFWKVWGLLDDEFVSASSTLSVKQDEKIYGAIQGLVASYGDPYTVFFPPEDKKEFDESIRGNFEGVGMEISIKDEILTVVSPIKDTPAERAGIKAGDKILEIDGKITLGMSIDEAVSYIKGPKGTSVELLVGREGQKEPLTISITRDVIKIPTIETELREDGVFVISLFNFSGNSESAFRAALREFLLSGTNKLVLDLRGNPGGFLDSAVDITSWFLPAGKVVVVEDFGDKKEERVFRSKGYNIFNSNLEMVVLINNGSASASEIVAGALQSHGIAQLVGTPSFGKGSVQELIPVTDDTSLKVTVAQWMTPDRVSISDGGLTPDIEVEPTQEEVEEGKDVQLEKAIEILLGNN